MFAIAAERRVAVEIDGYPDRQDIDWSLAAAALDAGCLFALDSDAHATEELLFSRMAVAHARLAGIPADRVINCWSNERLEEWMNRPERTKCGAVRASSVNRCLQLLLSVPTARLARGQIPGRPATGVSAS